MEHFEHCAVGEITFLGFTGKINRAQVNEGVEGWLLILPDTCLLTGKEYSWFLFD